MPNRSQFVLQALPCPPAASRRRGLSRELDAMTSKSKIESIKPDQQDFDSVEKEYGPLPPNPSQAALAERYRLRIATNIAKLPELLSRHQTWGVR